jgi:hypothetical protein
MMKRSSGGSRSSKKRPGSTYKKVGSIVLIEWEDAYSGSSWRHKDDIKHEALIVETVGYVHMHDKEGIYVIQTLAKSGDTSGRFFIPSGMIRKIKVLK